MIFDLLQFLAGGLAKLNISGIEEKAQEWLKEKGVAYPDIAARTDALSKWLSTTIAEAAPGLDPANMRDTLYGVASDLVRGTAGVDPDAWMGGG